MKKIPKAKKIQLTLRSLLLALIGLIIGASLYSWNAKSLTGNSLPMPFGVGAAIVMSGSMEPTLSVNDLVIIQKADDYYVDEIVVFQDRDGSMVIHTVISVDREGGILQTQGDANPSPDAPLDVKYVKGKMIHCFPGLGAFIRVLKSPPCVILILIASCLFLLRSYQKEKDSDSKKLDEIKEEIRKLKDEVDMKD